MILPPQPPRVAGTTGACHRAQPWFSFFMLVTFIEVYLTGNKIQQLSLYKSVSFEKLYTVDYHNPSNGLECFHHPSKIL